MTTRSTDKGMWCQNAPPSNQDPDGYPTQPGSGGTPCEAPRGPDDDEADEDAPQPE